MLYDSLFVRLSVLQIILFAGVFLGVYILYQLVIKRIQEKPILVFAIQIAVTVAVSYLASKIFDIHK